MSKSKYSIDYDSLAVQELKGLRRFDQVKVVKAIEDHLTDRPTQARGSRIKKLDPPVLAAYRLRVDDLRVFYDVDEKAHVVRIIAIRAKGQKTLGEIAHDPRD